MNCKPLSLFLALSLASSMPAMAGNGQGGRTLVSGTAVPSNCGDADFAAELSGDLNGCLSIFPQRFTCDELDGFSVYREWGEEQFNDDDGVSRFHTTYDFTGVFGPGFCTSFDLTTQLSGSCNHKLFRGQGRFRGTNGSIMLNDIIPDPGVSGASHYLYHGYVKLRD